MEPKIKITQKKFPRRDCPPTNPDESATYTPLIQNSCLYQEILAERDEILKHKWLESEKAGHDIGFEKALLNWALFHRNSWRKERKQTALQTTHISPCYSSPSP
jgi:hypothetical protein